MSDLKHLHHWDVLALACIDGRFIKRTVDWISEKTGGTFDFRTEVGCTKAILDCPNDCQRFFNVIETSLRLHSVKEVWLIDHIDCGAYGGSKEHEDAESEKEFHIEKLNKAAKIINGKFPELKVKKIYVGWNSIEEI